MKLSLATALAIATYVSASPLPDESTGLVKRASNAFAVGSKFNIDGSTNYFVGSNSYWISYLGNAADIDLTMSHVAASGLKVLRVWGFNDVRQQTSGDWMQSFVPGQQPQINLGANGLGKLDNVVAAAEKYNVKLIIPFVNFWNDYGGIQVYADYYGITKTAFYTNAAAQAQYKKYVATLVNKYKASTAIFAWELGNEPRCPGCATSVIYNWASDVSAYIKSLDPAHMVTLGDEGWMNGGGDGSYAYTTAEGVDFVKNLEIPTLDFGTFHLYPESWNLLPAQSAGSEWFKNHAAACLKAGKPCVAEEYGFTGSTRQTIIKAWQDTGLSLKDAGLAGAMFWQWGEQLSFGLTHDDGHAIYYNSPLWTTLVRDHVSSANAGGSVPTTTRSVPASTTTARVTTTSRAVVTTSAAVTRTTTTARPATTTPSSGGSGTAPKWGQCGGQGWTGPTVCVAGSTCTVSNQWYSQCL